MVSGAEESENGEVLDDSFVLPSGEVPWVMEARNADESSLPLDKTRVVVNRMTSRPNSCVHLYVPNASHIHTPSVDSNATVTQKSFRSSVCVTPEVLASVVCSCDGDSEEREWDQRTRAQSSTRSSVFYSARGSMVSSAESLRSMRRSV